MHMRFFAQPYERTAAVCAAPACVMHGLVPRSSPGGGVVEAHDVISGVCSVDRRMPGPMPATLSNTATSTVLISLGMAILINFEAQVAIIIGLSASTALFLPVSTPPNAIAYSTGFLKISDFRTGGLVVGLLGPLLAILWVLLMT